MCTEHSIGVRVDGALLNAGTNITIPSTESQDFNQITGFNESDQPVKVQFATDNGGIGSFIIPSGFTHTRKIEAGVIVNSSIKVISVGVANANGAITLNLGN